MEGSGAFSNGKVMMKELCRDEFEEKVLDMMSEGRGFPRQPRA